MRYSAEHGRSEHAWHVWDSTTGTILTRDGSYLTESEASLLAWVLSRAADGDRIGAVHNHVIHYYTGPTAEPQELVSIPVPKTESIVARLRKVQLPDSDEACMEATTSDGGTVFKCMLNRGHSYDKHRSEYGPEWPVK